MENPVVSVVKVDREPKHNDLTITLRFADQSTEVREILGIRVESYNRLPCLSFNIGDEENIFKDDTTREKYHVSVELARTIGYYDSDKTDRKMYNWYPQGNCVVITMRSSRNHEQFIAVGDYTSDLKIMYLKKVSGGYEVCDFNESLGAPVYSNSQFTKGEFLPNNSIQINARTGTLERC